MIEIREIEPSSFDRLGDIAFLYEGEGWGNAGETEKIKRALLNSYCAYGAFDGPKLVGFFRALSDGVGDAYLIDLVVHSQYRGRGIAHKLVDAITSRLKSEGIEWITCISTSQAKGVYLKSGSVMEGFTPFRFM